ncbi:dolichyl-phosphate beta-D-mannosyltransferase [Natronolimnohabitans innermongolicus JCM 12255]|uniref:Dolichyl-phosphate beta-D-mannosyltransferase n=1 Tax=Natronolimnohabitans innermongolicus JCM 12255 TaxID=1227499 RepID=L9XGK0_9EURY|nr:dolichyl-phosphate beta-D-mannosyltransferase [Natronolimnohabitans innermongolicus JCM 12255]
MIVADEYADETARVILRAHSHGHPVLVTHRAGGAGEALTFATQLGARVVPPEASDDSAAKALIEECRRLDYPGLIIHNDLEKRIDYDRALVEFEESAAYVVHAKIKADETRTDTIVGIPAYNEGDSIASIVSAAREYVDTVLVVDDGSTDDTADVARSAGATVFEHRQNLGYGGALKTVFRRALKWDVDHLVILDGDGQHDPADIPRLLERQRDTGAEIVVGSRFSPDSNTMLPVYRRIGLWVVNTLVNVSMRGGNAAVRDTQSGFRAYNARAIRSLATEPLGDHMDASIDVLYHAHRHGYRIEEVGTTIRYDVDNASSHNPIVHGLVLVKRAVETAGFERPNTVLGAPGFTAALFGLVTTLFFLLGYVPPAYTSPLTVILSAVVLLAGITVCFRAVVLGAVNTNREHR